MQNFWLELVNPDCIVIDGQYIKADITKVKNVVKITKAVSKKILAPYIKASLTIGVKI